MIDICRCKWKRIKSRIKISIECKLVITGPRMQWCFFWKFILKSYIGSIRSPCRPRIPGRSDGGIPCNDIFIQPRRINIVNYHFCTVHEGCTFTGFFYKVKVCRIGLHFFVSFVPGISIKIPVEATLFEILVGKPYCRLIVDAWRCAMSNLKVVHHPHLRTIIPFRTSRKSVFIAYQPVVPVVIRCCWVLKSIGEIPVFIRFKP